MGIMTRRQGAEFVISSDRSANDTPTSRAPERAAIAKLRSLDRRRLVGRFHRCQDFRHSRRRRRLRSGQFLESDRPPHCTAEATREADRQAHATGSSRDSAEGRLSFGLESAHCVIQPTVKSGRLSTPFIRWRLNSVSHTGRNHFHNAPQALVAPTLVARPNH